MPVVTSLPGLPRGTKRLLRHSPPLRADRHQLHPAPSTRRSPMPESKIYMMRKLKGGRYIPCSDYYWGMSHELVMQGIYFDPHEGSIQSFERNMLWKQSNLKGWMIF
ncbi:hypothetical protein BDA96_01G470900 [Sorghum bicolor]|uniref:Uncharacterized protein n=2 Tax=Sorghum bicolor TaxID=4558 RepID=A0A921V3L1_SORBI|nr:hypothetical protein BDA96_01G470900 [Sorghum bicolor]KXG39808.1 hypothetical protein SORBI_3001G442400 [Sorghum bicolor]